MGERPQRLFVAIALPPDIQEKLSEISQGIQGVRWLYPEQRHLTLKFIGDVGREKVEGVQQILRGITIPKFSLNWTGVGVFPLRGKPRILWVGLTREPALLALQRQVEAVLTEAKVGEPEIRPFDPHITLARLKDFSAKELTAFLEKNKPLALGSFCINCFHLFESELKQNGAVYRIIQTYELSNREF